MSHIIGTMGDLKSWVTGNDAKEYGCVPDGFVVVSCTHNLLKREMKELRLDLHQTIRDLKQKLYRHCGTTPDWMSLVLKTGGEVICELDDDSKKLGYYGIKHGMEIKIVDRNPHSMAKNGGLEDISLVKKYVMSDEEYDKRKNTLRAFKKEKLKEDPTFRLFPDRPRGGGSTKVAEPSLPGTSKDVEGMKKEMRCEVQPGGRRGKIGFVGEVDFAIGYWVGVVLDEPLGRNDGTVKGKRYMSCAPKYGIFVNPKNVKVGDFPEVDELATDSSDEEL